MVAVVSDGCGEWWLLCMVAVMHGGYDAWWLW